MRQDRLLSEFEALVTIDSVSLKEREMADYLKEKLTELGCEVEEDDGAQAAGGNAGNVIARFKGTDSTRSPILLSAHMDRVTPGVGIRPVREGNIFRSSGDTILGADDAAGIAIVLEVLRMLRDNRADHPDIEIVFSFCEEKGLLGAKALDKSKLRAKLGYVIDSGGPVNRVVVQSPSHITLDVKIKGRAAHAGVEPEKGIDAVQVAARAISQMKLGRIDDETTANLGMISGGRATNIVCDLVEVRGEARSMSREKLERAVASIQETFQESCSAAGAILEFGSEIEYETYNISPSSEVCQRLRKAGEKLGMEMHFVSAGGGSDANIYNAQGIECVVLGAGYFKPHTLEEYLDIEEFVKSASLVYEVVVA
ncbi:MAG: M20/M25/M40 family metallo-hydrolase [Bacillota bacterium]